MYFLIILVLTAIRPNWEKGENITWKLPKRVEKEAIEEIVSNVTKCSMKKSRLMSGKEAEKNWKNLNQSLQ